MIRRPSKSFVYLMVFLCPLTVALFFGLLPEVPGFEARPIRGEITFSNQKPVFGRATEVSIRRSATVHLTNWFEQSFVNFMRWEYNPWKAKGGDGFGTHYLKMAGSGDPADAAQAKEIQRLAEAWYQKLLLRYPEMAVTMKTIPDDRNGFLKWLEFCERLRGPGRMGTEALGLPKELDQYLRNDGPWNPQGARAWLSQQKSVVDEIRTIGLMPDASVYGVAVERWSFTSARCARDSAGCLIMEARLFAEQGNAAAALESIRAAKGFSDHFTAMETPDMIGAAVGTALQRELETRVLNEIMPALPPGQIDPAAWEDVLKPTVSQPSEFARYLKGEWSAATRQYLLPILLDAGEPAIPPDGGEMLDVYSSFFTETIRSHDGAALTDLPNLHVASDPDLSQLSLSSRTMVETFLIGMQACRNGWDTYQMQSGMTQAAFAILKGAPIPQDPIYGKDYQWDPVTRQLSMPAGKEFEGMKIKPIIVPKL